MHHSHYLMLLLFDLLADRRPIIDIFISHTLLGFLTLIQIYSLSFCLYTWLFHGLCGNSADTLRRLHSRTYVYSYPQDC